MADPLEGGGSRRLGADAVEGMVDRDLEDLVDLVVGEEACPRPRARCLVDRRICRRDRVSR